MRTRIVASAILALALLALVPAAALAVERTVTVEATATIKVPNDTATVGFGVSAERKSRGAALKAASARLAAVIAKVQAVPGVGDGDVKTGRVNVNKSFRGKVPIYRAGEGASVTLHEPSNAGELVQVAIAAGASGVNGPSYSVGDTEAATAGALAAAFQKAKAKATVLAAQAGATLGAALSIEEGGNAEIVSFEADQKFSGAGACAKSVGSTGVGSAPASKRAQQSACAPAPPTKPGKSTVTATVGVVFALQ